MADIIRRQGTGIPRNMYSRWRDMLDGTHALERWVQGQVSLNDGTGGVIGAVQMVDENGVAYGVRNVDNKPRVSAMPYTYDIAEGNIADHHPHWIFGSNPDVDTVLETIWDDDGLYPWPAGAETLSVVSASGNDTAAGAGGTGARTLTIFGLDADWVEYNETISLNGAGAVVTDNSFIRVNYATVRTAGATGSNEGAITITNSVTGNTLALIRIGHNRTTQAVWTVPIGNSAYLLDGFTSSDSQKQTTTEFYVRPFEEVFQLRYVVHMFGGATFVPFSMPIKFTARTDIEVRAVSVQTNAIVSAAVTLWHELE